MQVERSIPGFIAEKRGLRIRLLAIFLVLIYIPISLNMYIVYNKTMEIIKKDKIDYMKNAMEKTAQSVDSILSDLHRTAKDVADKGAVRKAIQDFESYNNMQKDRLNDYYAREFSKLETSPNVQHVFCISSKGKVYFGRDKESMDIHAFLDSPLYKSFFESDSMELWSYGNFQVEEEEQNLFFLALKLKGVDSEAGKPIITDENVGCIIFVLNPSIINFINSNSVFDVTGQIGFYDFDFNAMGSNVLPPIPEDVISTIRNQAQSFMQRKIKIDNSVRNLLVQRVDTVGWYIACTVPIEDLVSPVRDALKNSMWLILLVGIIASIWIVMEIMIITKLITEKQMADYRLLVSEEVNHKFRIYKHDLMNHIQIIQGLIQIGQPEKALQYSSKLTEEGRLISTKYEIGIPELESAIFSSVATAPDKGIDVKFDCMKLPEDINIKIYDLAKILVNLIKNAMFALERTDSMEKVLTIKIYEELGEYVFEIINNVPVIPEEIRKEIFDKGYTTKGKEGNGLGLYIVKKLAEKNTGIVELRVDKDGNHFKVRFPN